MDFTIAVKDLKDTLIRQVEPLTRDHTLDILRSIFFEVRNNRLTATATNLDIAARASCRVDCETEEGSFCISAERLSQLLRDLQTDEPCVHVHVADTELTLTKGFSRFKLPLKNVSDYPIINWTERREDYFSLPAKDFVQCLHKTHYIPANRETARVNIYHLEVKDGVLTSVGTNRAQVSIYSAEIHYAENGSYPVEKQIAGSQNRGPNVFDLSPDVISYLKKTFFSKRNAGDISVSVIFKAAQKLGDIDDSEPHHKITHLCFAMDGQEVMIKQDTQTFPLSWRDLLNLERNPPVVFSKTDVMKSLREFSSITKRKKEVRLSASEGDTTFTLSAEAERLGEYEASIPFQCEQPRLFDNRVNPLFLESILKNMNTQKVSVSLPTEVKSGLLFESVDDLGQRMPNEKHILMALR